MSNQLISVVVPVYNVSKYLNECIESIINQTYETIEILLIDDGSTDGSSEICDEWGKRDSRVVVKHKINGGLSDARNVGIAEARGSWITFIDSDDVVHRRLIEYLYLIAIESSSQISICNLVHWYDGQNPSFSSETKRVEFEPEDAICEMLYQRSFLVSACGKLYSKQCFDGICYPVGKLFEDSATTHLIFEHADKIVFGNAGYYAYRHRGSSITTAEFSFKDLDIWDICTEISRRYEKNQIIRGAAKSYQLSAALRIILNAPVTIDYANIRRECEEWIGRNYQELIRNKKLRKKSLVALLLFRYARIILNIIYKKTNRWS